MLIGIACQCVKNTNSFTCSFSQFYRVEITNRNAQHLSDHHRLKQGLVSSHATGLCCQKEPVFSFYAANGISIPSLTAGLQFNIARSFVHATLNTGYLAAYGTRDD
jgi:hypothetical protein